MHRCKKISILGELEELNLRHFLLVEDYDTNIVVIVFCTIYSISYIQLVHFLTLLYAWVVHHIYIYILLYVL